MKALLAALFLLAPLTLSAQKPAAKPALKATPKPASSSAGPSIPLHLIEAGDQGTLKLAGHTDQGAGGFRELSFKIGAASTTIETPNAVACIPRTRAEKVATGLWQTVAGAALDPSRCFFRVEFADENGAHTLLLFVGEGFASEAAPLLVIAFKPDGVPYKALALAELDPTAIEATTGKVRLIGKPTLSQVMDGEGSGSKPYALTYDPYAVYLFSPGGTATYSLAESQHYNEQHYVWAGSKSREDYAVLYNVPGHPKPFGAPANRVSSLLNTSSKSR